MAAVDLSAEPVLIISLTRELRGQFPHTPLVGLLCCPRPVAPEHVDVLAGLGMTNLLDLQASEEQILGAIVGLARDDGPIFLRPGLQRIAALRELATSDHAQTPLGTILSADDRVVLRLVAQGLSDEEIGRQLSLTRHAINHRLESLFRRLHARNRIELAAWAGYHRLYRPESASADAAANAVESQRGSDRAPVGLPLEL